MSRPLMSYLKPSTVGIVSFDELLDNYLKPMLKESYAVNIVLFLQDKVGVIGFFFMVLFVLLNETFY
jgi:hypothetical protein